MHRLKLHQATHQKRNVLKEGRARHFVALPQEEREAFIWAFGRAEEGANMQGVLHAQGLLTACWELGLGGAGTEERAEVFRICGETGDNVDLHEFAVDVVPRVRSRLNEMVSRELQRQFTYYDKKGDGCVSEAVCVSIARDIGLDADVVAEGISGHASVNFELFQAVVCKCKEKLQFKLRRYEVDIKSRMEISEELFQCFRGDLIVLYDLYHERNSPEGEGPMNISGIMCMMKDFGLMNRDPIERKVVDHFLGHQDTENGSVEYNFIEFLELINMVRNLLKSFHHDDRREMFNHCDNDHSGSLSIAEISTLLAHLGASPQTRAEQEELAELICLADDDGSGTIMFEEFQELAQRIEEKLNRLRFAEELDIGFELGFSPPQVRSFRFLFDELDQDGSGELDVPEVHAGLNILDTPVSQQQLTRLFQQLLADQHESERSEIDFVGFLKLMSELKRTRGLFQDDPSRQELTVPKALDARTLRRALTSLKLPKMYVSTLTREAMVARLCKHLKCRPTTLFHQQLAIGSVSELYERFHVD